MHNGEDNFFGYIKVDEQIKSGVHATRGWMEINKMVIFQTKQRDGEIWCMLGPFSPEQNKEPMAHRTIEDSKREKGKWYGWNRNTEEEDGGEKRSWFQFQENNTKVANNQAKTKHSDNSSQR